MSWGEESDPHTLGIWGPGDLVIPGLIDLEPLELCSLSGIQVQEELPTPEENHRFLVEQLRQTSSLLLLSRVRRAEDRLFQLLLWLGQRFGRVSSRGVSLSFDDMNLTHRQLAEISGATRVTVTKALSRFRNDGFLLKDGVDELLLHHAWPGIGAPVHD